MIAREKRLIAYLVVGFVLSAALFAGSGEPEFLFAAAFVGTAVVLVKVLGYLQIYSIAEARHKAGEFAQFPIIQAVLGVLVLGISGLVALVVVRAVS